MFPTRKNKPSKGYHFPSLLWIKQSVTPALTMLMWIFYSATEINNENIILQVINKYYFQ